MDPIQATRDWVDNFVVRHGLCPFAAQPLATGTVRFVATEAATYEALIQHFLSEVLLLTEQPEAVISTTLIIYPTAWADFLDFLDFIDACQDISSEAGSASFVQFAHFHPLYQFAGVAPDDPANATNRSPFPVLQLLRVDSVSAAIDHFAGDIHHIPERNIALLRSLHDTSQK